MAFNSPGFLIPVLTLHVHRTGGSHLQASFCSLFFFFHRVHILEPLPCQPIWDQPLLRGNP